MVELQRTVEIADGNLRSLAGSFGFDTESDPANDQTMFGRDLRLSTWLSQQVGHEIAYTGAITDRASEVYNLTSLRLQSVTEEVTRRRERVELLQTVLLATLLSGLYLIDTFQLTLTVSPELKRPLLAGLLTVLISVPLVTTHWFGRLRASDRVAAALTGSALAWRSSSSWHGPTMSPEGSRSSRLPSRGVYPHGGSSGGRTAGMRAPRSTSPGGSRRGERDTT